MDLMRVSLSQGISGEASWVERAVKARRRHLLLRAESCPSRGFRIGRGSQAFLNSLNCSCRRETIGTRYSWRLRMPYRTKATLERWLEQFHQTREGGMLINVAVQDGEGGADTGLVIVPLRDGIAEIYMEPTAIGSPEWAITISTVAGSTDLSPSQLQGLAAELAVAASLCQFLQDRSADDSEDDAPRA